MTELIFLTDSYLKTLKTKLISCVKIAKHYQITLQKTNFYPEGGGQPSDKGLIIGKNGQLEVTHVRMQNQNVVHDGHLTGKFTVGEIVETKIDWDLRFEHMRWHSAGHVVHEIVMKTVRGLEPVRAEHCKPAFIEYIGQINPHLKDTLQNQANMLVAEDRAILTEIVSLDELKRRAVWLPQNLPTNKPLRILEIQGYSPMPDGGTLVMSTSEIGNISISEIKQLGDRVRVYYQLEILPAQYTVENGSKPVASITEISLDNFKTLLLTLQQELMNLISTTPLKSLEDLKVTYFGHNGKATRLIKELKLLPQSERKAAGMLVNEFKNSVLEQFKIKAETPKSNTTWFDTSLPGILPPVGHLHLVTQAIIEITRIFATIGFTRVRHPEVDWDWYPFTSLNMPPESPASDEWETFFVDYPGKPVESRHSGPLRRSFSEASKRVRQPTESVSLAKPDLALQDTIRINSDSGVSRLSRDPQNDKFSKIVLTPHTSNGQVREMEKGKLPIRMINIAKCYRRQEDVSHTAMFHQFEGLFVDKNVSIGHLKGVLDFFFKQYYGPERRARIRPFHFQFTEPSFEVDVSCGICSGRGCRLCKEGWLELGGAGMVHPTVLKNGGVDSEIYSGFAFGWGIERVAIMKTSGIDDNRQVYSNDVRFLEQF